MNQDVYEVDVEGAQLFCRTMGKGKPLVILHGGPGLLTHDYLLPAMNRLSENNFVVFYDQRGCGRSKACLDADSINIRKYVSDLEAIRNYFDCQDFSLLGHSWGAFLAMNYVIAFPKRVERIILSNPAPMNSVEYALFAEHWMSKMAVYLDEIKKVESSEGFALGDEEVSKYYNRLVFGAYFHLSEKVDLLNLKMSPEVFLNGRKVYEIFNENLFSKSFDCYEAFNEVRAPTLIIHGNSDIVPLQVPENIHAAIHHSKYHLIEECGHFPFVEKPDEFFEVVRSFLKF